MKNKILIIVLMLSLILLGYGITYSFFHSNTTLGSSDQNIASFIFNSKSLNEFQLSLIDLKPGDDKGYDFSVSNNYMGKVSNVSVNYLITFKTYHFVPLVIELYKLDGENEELVLSCDESYDRNENNELVCEAPIQKMGFTDEKLDNYRLKVKFPNEYNSAEYSSLVDYINVELKGWQSLKD